MLQGRILRDAALLTRLLTQLSVPVTDLFRDPPYFASLRSEVVPMLATYPSLTLWVAGCSTGEEVYSLAIVLAESGLLERTMIYATDISPASLQVGEAAVYPLGRVAGTWSDHCLATDAVFAEVQLVSRRNVWIYFDRELQERALQLFHDALAPRGFVGIGARESMHGFRVAHGFEVVSRDNRIYRRLA